MAKPSEDIIWKAPGDVWIGVTQSVEDFIVEQSEQIRDDLQDYMERIARREHMPPQNFESEHKHSPGVSGLPEVHIWAFKPRDGEISPRIYGGRVSPLILEVDKGVFEEHSCLICTNFEPAKKKQKADRKKLKKTAELLAPFLLEARDSKKTRGD